MTTADLDSRTALEHAIGPRGSLTIRQSSGEVSIRGVEGSAVRVRSLDGRALADLFSIELRDGAIELRQIERLGLAGLGILGRGEGAELEVEVPHGARVSIDAQSADIEASDLSGAKRFRTASGEVRLRRLAGQVDVETVSGEVELDGSAPMELAIRTVSGDMRARAPLVRRLDLSTTSGDIRLDAALDGDGPFAIRSISGDVQVVGRGGLRVEAESITGDLVSDLPSRRESMVGRKVLLVGKSGPTLTFRSVSGDFRVGAPRDAAPAGTTTATSDRQPPAPDAGGPPPEPAAELASPPDPAAGAPEAGATDAEAARLEILRALERGDIDVAEATTRLGRLDEVLP
jgi:DUF4097 and DUF4098 domain-containing protein YvlB